MKKIIDGDFSFYAVLGSNKLKCGNKIVFIYFVFKSKENFFIYLVFK